MRTRAGAIPWTSNSTTRSISWRRCLAWLTRLGFRTANQSVRPRLDSFGKFLQVLGNLPHVLEDFVKVGAVYVESAVELVGQRCSGRQGFVQLYERCMNFGLLVFDHLVHVGNGVVGFLQRGLEIIQQRGDLRGGLVHMLERGVQQ